MTASQGADTGAEQAPPLPPPRSRRRELWEWLWRSRALADADRLVVAAVDPSLIQQAREHVELGDRLMAQIDVLRSGSGLGTALLLYREALGLVAAASREPDARDGRERIHQVLGREATETAMETADALLSASSAATAHLSEQERVTQAHAARALLRLVMGKAAATERPRARIVRQRITRTGALATLVVALAICAFVFIPRLTRPRNLLEHSPWHASSAYSGFSAEAGIVDGRRTRIFFHTGEDRDPFIEFDMGKVQTLRHFEIQNRRDAFDDRAVPLVIQISVDGKRFDEVARRAKPFDTFKADMRPAQARFVKVLVHKKTWFHLEGVAAW